MNEEINVVGTSGSLKLRNTTTPAGLLALVAIALLVLGVMFVRSGGSGDGTMITTTMTMRKRTDPEVRYIQPPVRQVQLLARQVQLLAHPVPRPLKRPWLKKWLKRNLTPPLTRMERNGGKTKRELGGTATKAKKSGKNKGGGVGAETATSAFLAVALLFLAPLPSATLQTRRVSSTREPQIGLFSTRPSTMSADEVVMSKP